VDEDGRARRGNGSRLWSAAKWAAHRVGWLAGDVLMYVYALGLRCVDMAAESTAADKSRQNFLSAGGERTRPCLADTNSVGHQGCIARRRPPMRQSRGFKIRGVTPIQHGRLRSPRTETKL
jgi:hypothetical protein